MNRTPVLRRGSGWSRAAFWVGTMLLLSALVGTLVYGQISEADKKKRDAFIKAREEMRTVATPTPADSLKASGKPKVAKKKKKKASDDEDSATPEPTKTPAAKKATRVDEDDEDAAAPSATRAKKKASPTPAETPRSRQRTEEDEEEPTPRARATASVPDMPPVRAVPVPTALPSAPQPTLVLPPADITIQKSGVEEEQGFEPPPPPPPRRGFFARLFGGREASYRYLSRGVIDAIRRAPVQRARWKFIIVHNSGTRQGNARAFDYYHRNVRRMQNGMAYHFVVGNGTSSGNGQVEIGSRWQRQINGGHVHSDYLNNISLGICLVGDFNRDRPTKAQLEASEELIRFLRERCGKADGRAIPVRPHREMNPPQWSTDCPGDAFPYGWFRKF